MRLLYLMFSCKQLYTVSESTSKAMNLLNASILSGGPDGRYTAQLMADGGVGFGDLRPYGVDADFIGQAIHTTYAPNYYNDTIDFAISPNGDTGSSINIFSLSLIGGAYCNDGQNYFNIVQLMESIPWSEGYKAAWIDGSCPDPSSRPMSTGNES